MTRLEMLKTLRAIIEEATHEVQDWTRVRLDTINVDKLEEAINRRINRENESRGDEY